MNKPVKYILLIAVIGLLGYKSVYFKKLSEVIKPVNSEFDAEAYSKRMWEERMPARIDSAVDLSQLIQAVTTDKEAAFQKYSNALAIGNYRYVLIKTRGTVMEVKEDEIQLQLPVADSLIHAVLATEFVYGNAVRDASAFVDVKDFPNTAELNGISEELNKIIRTVVLPSFKSAVKKGDKIRLTAAIELNKEHIKWSGMELIPVRLEIVQ